MKDDEQFLAEIYKKSKLIKSDTTDWYNVPKISFVKKFSGIAVAAILIIVIAPSLYFGFNRSYEMFAPIPLKSEDAIANKRAIPGIQTFAAVSDVPTAEILAEQSDVIVEAKVKKIEKSEYESDNELNNHMTTMVVLTANECLKGDIDAKNFSVKVDGGYDEKTSNYIPYEAVFTKNEETLLFLTQITDNEYALTLSADSKYTVQNSETGIYKGKDGNTINVTELKESLN